MKLGPMQLIFAAFEGDVLESGVIDELFAATGEAVSLLDLLVVEKDSDGKLWLSDVGDETTAEEVVYGSILGKIIDIGADETIQSASIDDEESLARFVVGVSPGQVNDLMFSLPSGHSAVVALLHHVWAVELHQSVLASGGVMLAQALIQPEALDGMDAELSRAIEQAVAINSA